MLRILVEHKEMVYSLESKLFFIFMCFIRILNNLEVIAKTRLSKIANCATVEPWKKKIKEIHPKKENKSSLSDVNRHIIRDLMAPIPGVYHAVNWRIIDHRIPLVFIRKWYIHEFKCLWTKIIINIQLSSTTPDFCENLGKWRNFSTKISRKLCLFLLIFGQKFHHFLRFFF